jgi:outer membrane protein assembly factor BamB/tetratricopeptide (TPR) repeat protein
MTPSRGPLTALALACLVLPAPAADPPEKTESPRLTLPRDPKASRKFQALGDYVKSADWRTAVVVAQELLDLPSDVFVSVGDTEQGIRFAVNRVLADLPNAGRDAYQAKYGETAAALLAKARTESDRQLLAEVARRYLRTKAGAEAVDELRKAVKEPPAKPKDWPMFGGTPNRGGQGDGGAPSLQPMWRYSLFSTDGSQVKRWISNGDTSVVSRLESKGEAVIPAFVPVTATVTGPDGKPRTVIIYRDHDGVASTGLKTGKREWMSRSHWSLEAMCRDGQKARILADWVGQFKDTLDRPAVLIENAAVGTLSCDDKNVYLIDDLQLPPFVDPKADGEVNKWVKPGVDANMLQAFPIASGKLMWELGGAKTADDDAKPKHDFRDSHFLGPPLPLDGKLYFLNEKDREIRLVCLDTGKLPARNVQLKDLDDAIVWVQPLGTAREKILIDFGRRINGTQIAYGDGVLVCPTNTGALVGVDALTHNLLWAHTYADVPAKAPPGAWKASAPIVQSGKVVFALPDGPELRCLDLRTGRLRWGSKRREDDIYLGGVIADRVVIVGKKDVRALALDDGKEAWSLPTGRPSGRGAASENVFYLPLKDTVDGTGPEVVAIDVAKGRAVGHARAEKDPRTGSPNILGNIIFSDGVMVSQSATELVVFPLLKAKLKETEDQLKKDPNSPRGLFDRGRQREGGGNLLGAAEDYRAALAGDPPPDLAPQLRARLIDVLTELLRRDFGAGEMYLKECEALIGEPADPKTKAETLRRRVTLLTIKGRGYEAQGKVVDALDAYLELGALKDDRLLSVVDEPSLKASPAAWARSRITALYAAAKPPLPQRIDEEIDRRWTALRKGKDEDALRAFVSVLSPSFAAGREASLELAERLMKGDRAAHLEAEALLLRLSDQREDLTKAVQALESLARLMARRGELEDALLYYRRMARDFPTTVVRDGKKGADYLNDLAGDKRFSPYLETEPPAGKPRWSAQLTVHDKPPTQPPPVLYTFAPRGEVLPSLLRYRFALNDADNFKIIDRQTGEQQETVPVRVRVRSLLHAALNTEPLALHYDLGYHAAGHILVVSMGQWVMGFDALGNRVLWERRLVAPPQSGSLPEIRIEPEDGSLHAVNADKTTTRVARVGLVAAGLVVLLTQDGLSAVDVLTGQTVWQRSDVAATSAVFGDGERVYAVARGADGKATGTRAFRARDGAAVAVTDFATVHDQRVRVAGGELLAVEKGAGGLVLRLYDPAAGKDVWSQKFAAGSVVMRSHDPDLAGVLAPDGQTTVVSLSRRKVVMGGIVGTDHVKNLIEAHLLADGQAVYIALHNKDPQREETAGESNLQPFSGLRGIKVNGFVYSFNRHTSKIIWASEVREQELVVEPGQDLPVLLFTARSRAGRTGRFIALEILDKRTGKLFFRFPPRGGPALDPATNGSISAIRRDPASDRIELLADTYKVTITRAPEPSP